MLKKIDNCKLCLLHKYRTQIVWPYIPHRLEWNGLMLIGEAPGEDEDREGIPFVGKAGKMLDKCLEEAKIDRRQTYITNLLKCRPPNNAIGHPEAKESLSICPFSFLNDELDDRALKLIVTLGATAMFYFTGEKNMLRNRGRIWSNGDSVSLLSTIHPSFILRGGALKRDLVEDLEKAKGLLDDTP